ncbi:hypothetical protein Tco_1556532 [Tanacetum coccineum]
MWNSSPIPTYSNNDTFENMFAHGIQNHEQPESIPDTYVIERYKEKEKHFAKETTIESEYCKKIKLLNEEISNRKSQACKKETTFIRENAKYDEYVQPLLKKKNELETVNQEFLKQINDLDNKLLKTGHIAQTLHMLLPKEDSVNTGKQGLGFENQNDVENPFVLNRAKKLAPKMKDDLNCVMSLEDEFDEKCLILDIQIEFFKSQFESTMLESHNHVYENEMFEQNSSLKSEIHCLKKTITELSKHVADVKKEMTKRCAQYEKDFAKLEAHYISLELKSQNKSLTYVQNGHVLNQNSDEAKIKF